MVVAAKQNSQELVASASLRVLSSLSYRHGELDSYLQSLVSGLNSCIQADWVVITFGLPQQESVLASSLEVSYRQTAPVLDQFLHRTCSHRGRVWLIDGPHQDCDCLPDGYLAGAGIQLRSAQGRILGTLCLFNRDYHRIRAEVVQAAQAFAERAASAIDSYLLYQQQHRLNQLLANGLTGAHCPLSPHQASDPPGQLQVPSWITPACQAAIDEVEVLLARLTTSSPQTATARSLVQNGLDHLMQFKRCLQDIRQIHQEPD